MDSRFAHRLLPFLASAQGHTRGRLRVAALTTVTDRAEQRRLCTGAAKLPNIDLEYYAVAADKLQATFAYGKQNGTQNILDHVSASTMLRLLAPVMLPYKRVVYLDLDVLVRTDLARLQTGQACTAHDPAGRVLHSSGICAKSTIQDNFRRGWLRPELFCVFGIEGPRKFPQFNAGVMVMDLERMHRRHAVRYAIALSNMFGLNDQAILNLYANGAFDELAPQFNVYYGQDSDGFSTADAILHPAGPQKPWLSASHKWADAWLEHEEMGHLFVWTSAVDCLARQDVEAVEAAAEHSGGRPVTAFCGNAMCMDALSHLPHVQVIRFRVRDFVTSPLAPWFDDHALLKILHGVHYEKHLQAAARLAILYHYGGVLHDGGVAMQRTLPGAAWSAERPWCYATTVKKSRGSLGQAATLADPSSSHKHHTTTAFAPRRDPRVLEAMRKFIADQPVYRRGDPWPIDWTQDWMVAACPFRNEDRSSAFSAAADYFTTVPDTTHDVETSPRPTFGALWYDERARYVARAGNHAVNLGDDVQSLAAVQWLPFIEHKIERDRLVAPPTVSQGQNVTVVLNAWYGTPNMTWPPQGQGLDTIPVAVHIEPKVQGLFSQPASLEYMTGLGTPIGARDASTLDFLQALNVSAFFSGCMTMTMGFLTPDVGRHDTSCGVLFVDVQKDALKDVVPQTALNCG